MFNLVVLINLQIFNLPWVSLLVFDQLDLVTYEEVVKLQAFRRKTLVLLGKKNYILIALILQLQLLITVQDVL